MKIQAKSSIRNSSNLDENRRITRSIGDRRKNEQATGTIQPKKRTNQAAGRSKQYRSTLTGIQTLYDEIRQSIQEHHMEAIQRTPFRHFFAALKDREIIKQVKKSTILDDIINSFDKTKKKFKFGGSFHAPTKKDVTLIFAIEDGTEEVTGMKGYGWEKCDLAVRLFNNVGNGRLTSKMVKDKAKELVNNTDQTSIDDIVKLLCLILLHTVFFSNLGEFIPWGFLHYVNEFQTLSSYDWSNHICKHLMKELQKDWEHPYQVNGCTLLLIYWLCEHTDCIENKYGRHNIGQGTTSKGIPRITKWEISKLEKLIAEGYLHGSNIKFNNKELQPTDEERQLIKTFRQKPGQDKRHNHARNEVHYHSKTNAVTPQMEELKLFSMQEESKTSGLNDLQENPAKKIVAEKRKLRSNASDDVCPAKCEKNAGGNPKKTEEKGKKQASESGGNNVTTEGQAKKGSGNKKVTPQMEELKLIRMQEESKTSGLNDLQENPAKKNVVEKRKLRSNTSDDVSPAKRAKDASGNPKKTQQKGKKQTAESGANNVTIEGQAKKGSDNKKVEQSQAVTEKQEGGIRKIGRQDEHMHWMEEKSADELDKVQNNLINTDPEKKIKELNEEVSILKQQLIEKEKRINELTPKDLDHNFIRRLLNFEVTERKEPIVMLDSLPDDKDTEIARVAIKQTKGEYKCGEYILDEAFAKLCKANENSGRMGEVWQNLPTKIPFVTVASLTDVLDENFIGESVIDATIIIMERHSMMKHGCTVIHAGDLGYMINMHQWGENDNQIMRQIVDALKEGHQVFFPLCCRGRQKTPYHWVLLTYNLFENEWRMYNSLASKTRSNPFLKDCKMLQHSVWKWLQSDEDIKRGKQSIKLGKIVEITDLPTQDDDSVECAIFLIHYMQKLLTKQTVKPNLKREDVQKLKGMVINTILLDKMLIV